MGLQVPPVLCEGGWIAAPPKVSMSYSIEPVKMSVHVAKGTLQRQ